MMTNNTDHYVIWFPQIEHGGIHLNTSRYIPIVFDMIIFASNM